MAIAAHISLSDSGVEWKDAPLWWHLKGLSYTASGYGRRIPTARMVKLAGRWRRIYCCIYSNAGTCYVTNRDGDWIVITD